jgi:glycosyltransferase involved in cell wall biosynthesis
LSSTTRVSNSTSRRGRGNWGLRHATAPLVLFLDADDVLVPDALMRLLGGYADSGGRYAYADWAETEDEQRLDSKPIIHKMDPYDQRTMLRGLLHPISALIPAEWMQAVGGFDESLPVFEDWDFFCKLAASGYCGVRVPQPLLIYRRDSGLRTKAALKPRERPEDVMAYTPLGEAAAAAIADRYASWTSGEEPIMGCCGGNSQVIAQANDALGDMVAFATNGAALMSTSDTGMVRMEFVGDQQGAQTFIGKGSGLSYRAGREQGSRFHNVDPRDVEHFVNTGLFRIVSAEVLASAATVEEVPIVPVEPRAEPTARRVKGRKA